MKSASWAGKYLVELPIILSAKLWFHGALQFLLAFMERCCLVVFFDLSALVFLARRTGCLWWPAWCAAGQPTL